MGMTTVESLNVGVTHEMAGEEAVLFPRVS
jgi:hypothetical protein